MTLGTRVVALLMATFLFLLLPRTSVVAQASQEVELFVVDTLPRGGDVGTEIEVPSDPRGLPRIYFAKGAATGAELLAAMVAVRSIRGQALSSGRSAKIRLTKAPARETFSEAALAFADGEAIKLNAAISSKRRPAVARSRAPQKLLKERSGNPEL